MLHISVVQPSYFAGDHPDEPIAQFLMEQMEQVEPGGLIVLPEYSNAGGLSDVDSELKALPRAEKMLQRAAEVAKSKGSYVAINVLRRAEGEIKNSTFLFDKEGKTAFIYDKQHLPNSEIKLGVTPGNGSGKVSCTCVVDGIRFAFLTCYDVYFNEQIEHIAKFKPDIIITPTYQRGERTDIIRAQAKLIAFRCNAYVARSSYSMQDDGHGGCSMIVAPDGQILKDMGKEVGCVSADVDPFFKHTRPAGFGSGVVRNDDFISAGLCPEAF